MNKYQEFIYRMYPLILDYTSRNKLPRSLADNMMRQIAFESNYGTAPLALKQHNYGGYGRTGKGVYRSYKTDQDFVNDYGSYFSKRKDLQNAKNIMEFGTLLGKKYGYYQANPGDYAKNLAQMRQADKYMTAYTMQNAKKALDQYVSRQAEQPTDAIAVQPKYNFDALLTPADIITAKQQFQNIIQPSPFDNLRGSLMQNLNQLQYSTPQEYMQQTSQYDNGKDYNGYVNALERAANKIQNSPYAWRDKDGQKLSIDRMLLQMMNDNTYKYKDVYDNGDLTDPSGNMHFSDKYKTAYHPTFSIESIFSGKKSENNPEGIIGGVWSKDWSKYYVGDRDNSRYFSPIRTMMYLKNAESKPVKLIYDSGIRDVIRTKRLKNHKVFGYDYGKSIPSR